MKKNRFSIIAMVLALIFVLSACSSSASSGSGSASSAAPSGAQSSQAANGAQKTIKISMAQINGSPNFDIANSFLKPLVEKQTNGAYTIQVFGNSTLAGGDQLKAIEMAQKGTIDMCISSGIVTSNIVPDLAAISIPWIWKDEDTLYKTLDPDTDVGKRFGELMLQKNLVLLGFAENGFRELTNNVRPVTKPEDIKGLKLRVLNSTMLNDMFRSLGANVVYVDGGEIYTGLQQGVFDGQENPLVSHNVPFKMYEVQKYYTIWHYCYDALVGMMGTPTWDKFSDDMKATMKDSMKQFVTEERKETARKYDEDMKIVQDAGMQITTLTPEQIQVFKDAVTPAISADVAKFDSTVVQLLQDANK